jgi:hypothetical protein
LSSLIIIIILQLLLLIFLLLLTAASGAGSKQQDNEIRWLGYDDFVKKRHKKLISKVRGNFAAGINMLPIIIVAISEPRRPAPAEKANTTYY